MPPPDDASALLDIRHAARLIVSATERLDASEFLSDWLVSSAVERQLTIIGEAVKRLTQAFRESHDGVDWRGWAGLRDIVVHAYDAVEPQQIWQIVRDDLPALLAVIEPELVELGY
ncbi:MAG: DUF86 domain-containing protein [Dehalococcoidia bacterium]